MITSTDDETTLIYVKQNLSKLWIKRNFLNPHEMLKRWNIIRITLKLEAEKNTHYHYFKTFY